MSEPRRWLDDPDGAPDDVRALLRGAEPTRAPDAAALARVTERVSVATAAGAVTAAGVTWWKLGALAVGLAASVAVLAPRKPHGPPVALARTAAPVVRPLPAPAVTLVVTPAAAPVVVPSRPRPTPAPVAARPMRVARAVTAPRGEVAQPSLPIFLPHDDHIAPSVGLGHVAYGSAADALTEEAAWIDRAHQQLDADPAAALRTLRTYPTRFPRGQLQGEARYLTFEALRRSGATAEARAHGERMLRDDPNGPYARRIRSAGR
jgi:hypothetical protein